MKKSVIIILMALILVSGAYAKLNLKLEGAGHIAIGDDTAIMLDGGGIVDINERFAVRFILLRLQFDPTALYLSTGSEVDGLIYFPMANSSILPYGVAGLQLNSWEDYTLLQLNIGGGAEFGSPQSALRPFAELIIGIMSLSYDTGFGDYSDSETVIGIRGGIRYDLGK